MLLAAVLSVGATAARADATAPAPRDVARTFYDAFCRGDARTMESLYSPGVKFRDEIFKFEDRAGVMGMWNILVDPAKGGKFSYEILDANDTTAHVRWLADYKFPDPKSGRPVHNVVTAELTIADGKIVEHRDSFSWAKWSRQAFPLGPVSDWGPVRWLLKAGIRTALAHSGSKARPAAEAAKPQPKSDGITALGGASAGR